MNYDVYNAPLGVPVDVLIPLDFTNQGLFNLEVVKTATNVPQIEVVHVDKFAQNFLFVKLSGVMHSTQCLQLDDGTELWLNSGYYVITYNASHYLETMVRERLSDNSDALDKLNTLQKTLEHRMGAIGMLLADPNHAQVARQHMSARALTHDTIKSSIEKLMDGAV